MTQHTPSPWILVQEQTWPFDIKIKSGDYVVMSQGRYSYSSKDRDLNDVLNAVHFKFGEERENASTSNKAQLANLKLIAAAPELLEALEEMVNKYCYLRPEGYGSEGTKAMALIDRIKGE